MFPAHRGGMGKEIVGHRGRGRSQMLDGGVHVSRVPIDNGGDHQVEAGCPILLGLMAAIDDAPLTESVDLGGRRILLKKKIWTCLATPAQVVVLTKVTHDKSQYNMAIFISPQFSSVLSYTLHDLLQHYTTATMTVPALK